MNNPVQSDRKFTIDQRIAIAAIIAPTLASLIAAILAIPTWWKEEDNQCKKIKEELTIKEQKLQDIKKLLIKSPGNTILVSDSIAQYIQAEQLRTQLKEKKCE